VNASELATERYVLLTTFRKNGQAVATAVWIAALADGSLGFTTGGDSGKVKRIRNSPRVLLQPCDVRGRVATGSTATEATARVVKGAECAPVTKAIRKKYSYQYVLVDLSGRISAVFRRRRVADAGVIITVP